MVSKKLYQRFLREEAIPGMDRHLKEMGADPEVSYLELMRYVEARNHEALHTTGIKIAKIEDYRQRPKPYSDLPKEFWPGYPWAEIPRITETVPADQEEKEDFGEYTDR